MPARIVVADDDADILRLISFTLRRRGHTVLEAPSGDVALELIRREMPDLVILDVMMPGLSGLEVARALASDATTVGIPLILVSARGQPSEITEGLASGARAYIVKPFVPQDLASQVSSILADSGPESKRGPDGGA